MKTYLLLLIVYMVASCANLKEGAIETNENLCCSMEMLNINENGFRGNIVVEVYDVDGNKITDYQSIVVADERDVFDVPQKEFRCTFYTEGDDVTVEIRKEGYKTVKTDSFATDEELEFANFIKVKLEKL